MQAASSELEELIYYLDFLFEGQSGFAYLALKLPEQSDSAVNLPRWSQLFFEWPSQKNELIQTILTKAPTFEVYLSPSLYLEKSGEKEAVLGSTTYWVDFDGVIPSDLQGLPPPSLRVRSSVEGREHWYWKSDTFLTPKEIERVNRALTYIFGADVSGWNSNKVLRPPCTFNHKRARQVSIVLRSEAVINPVLFSALPEPPPLVEVEHLENLPPVEDVIAKYIWPKNIWELFKTGKQWPNRATGLMQLGYFLAEIGLMNEEMLSVLLNADARWGKFSGRADQITRLLEIITVARTKHPYKSKPGSAVELQSLGLVSLLKTEVSLEWVWEGFLHKKGYMLLTGPAGIGKSQMALDAASHFARGRNFLDANVSKPMKVGFFSLEMGIEELKYFLNLQTQNQPEEDLEILEQNLRFFPLGEPLYLNREEERIKIESVIRKENLQGVIIDSMGSSTEGELSQEGPAKSLMDWNDYLRQDLGVFTWFIHHHRLATNDNKRPNKLSDVYGNQYLTARASTVICLWTAGVKNSIQVVPLKVRLMETPDPFLIYRDSRLRFTKKTQTITIIEEEPDEVEKEKQEEEQKLTESFKPAGLGLGMSGI